MTRMHNPPYPGETLREDVLPAMGLSVTEAAKQIGVTRATLCVANCSSSGNRELEQTAAMLFPRVAV